MTAVNPEPLPICPFTVSLDLREGSGGEVHLVNPGASWLAVPSLPLRVGVVISFCVVLSERNQGKHTIRAELVNPEGAVIGSNEDEYSVPSGWKSPSAHARLVTVPLNARVETYGPHLIRLVLDGEPARPDWPVEVTRPPEKGA